LEVRNPTHGSGWIVQILPTSKLLRNREIPPTAVGGLFRSCLRSRDDPEIVVKLVTQARLVKGVRCRDGE
jgi:hypothetical protein